MNLQGALQALTSGPVSMISLAVEEDQKINSEIKSGLITQINYNSEMKAPVNSLMKEEETEDEMKARFKMARRGEKMLKRAARREKLLTMQREEFMRELTRDPVVLHWHAGGGSNDIHLRQVQMDVNGLALLDETDLTLVSGRKYGLIGRNGIGKTTFLKFLACHRFEGMPAHLQILHIEQEVAGGDASVLETVLATDIERAALLAEEQELMAEEEGEKEVEDEQDRQQRLAEVIDRLVEIDAYSAPARAASILSGLGFDPEMQLRPTNGFSGGWRMRVSLARALFIEPDVMLLDEPTNHLDLHAVLWLQDYLINWDKTLVVVSHARSFLNAVVTDILHFQGKSITRYKGDYDYFEGTRAEAMRQDEKRREAHDKTRAHMEAFISKFRSNASRAAMVQSRIKALGRMEAVSEVLNDPSLCFAFPSPEPLSTPILQLVDVGFGYGDEQLFSQVHLGLDMQSRVALVGKNGVGKTTLLKIILRELEPQTGAVHRNGRLRIGRFSQHHIDQLDLRLTALESFVKQYPDVKPLEIRAHLGSMGLGGTTALQKMSTLSGGQKSRVAFAQIIWEKPHLLLLDEPTNHLDLDAVTALIHAILNFDGGVLCISHDEFLVSSICEELWVAEPGKVNICRDSFEAFRKKQLAQMKPRKGLRPAISKAKPST